MSIGARLLQRRASYVNHDAISAIGRRNRETGHESHTGKQLAKTDEFHETNDCISAIGRRSTETGHGCHTGKQPGETDKFYENNDAILAIGRRNREIGHGCYTGKQPGKTDKICSEEEKNTLECGDNQSRSYVALLRACSQHQDMQTGRDIHAEILSKGLLEKDVFIGSSLINMYVKCGSLSRAQEVFDQLLIQDPVSWSALLAGYAHYGKAEEALKCFARMQLESVSPDAVTFVGTLKACGSIGAIDKGREIHVRVVSQGILCSNIIVGNALVDMYAKCGLLEKAQEVFDELPFQNLVTWSTLIAGYAQHGHAECALICFYQMRLEGISPNGVTFVSVLKACGSIEAAHTGQHIHAEIVTKGLFQTNCFIGAALVDLYAKCGFLAKAAHVFDKFPIRDIVMWSALIAGYAHRGYGQEALNCSGQMQLEGVSPDAFAYVCFLKACGCIGAIDKGYEIHADIVIKGLLEDNVFLGAALVDMYAKCGSLTKAQEVFDKLPIQNTVTWNTLITAYSQMGKAENVFDTFDNMISKGIKPDSVTFLTVLNACNYAGLVEKGQMYFQSMSKDYDVLPTSEHLTCMIDIFFHSGQVDKAVSMMGNTPLRADPVVWHSILNACQKWGIVELGRQAFELCFQE